MSKSVEQIRAEMTETFNKASREAIDFALANPDVYVVVWKSSLVPFRHTYSNDMIAMQGDEIYSTLRNWHAGKIAEKLTEAFNQRCADGSDQVIAMSVSNWAQKYVLHCAEQIALINPETLGEPK